MVNQIRKTTDISKKICDQALKTPDLKLQTIQLKSNESKTAKSRVQIKERPEERQMSGSSKTLWKFWINFENLPINNDLRKREKLTKEQYIIVQTVVTSVLMNETLVLLHES